MRAVNLIPADERRDGRISLSQLHPATLGLLGALLAAIIVVTALALIGNTTNDRRDQAARIEAETAVVQRKTDALMPNTTALQARERSVAAVRSLAGTRYDWSRVLGSVSRRLPSNVALTNFNGAVGAATATGTSAAATSTTGPPPGATVALTGCAASLNAIARLMERMRAIDDVQDVTFTTSTKGVSGRGSGDCRYPRSFEVTIALEGPPAVSTEAAPASTTGVTP